MKIKHILIIGAGRSSSSMIDYLLQKSITLNLFITVCDQSYDLAVSKVHSHANAQALALEIHDTNKRQSLIKQSDIVISMLPAAMHIILAQDCITYKKNLVTASYISKQMRELNDQAKQAKLIFLNETGLDPGIDHMSAMEIIDNLIEQNAEIESFKSYCGGLIAPESDDNRWHYKFTWNPRNVILAAQGGIAKFLENNNNKYIPYSQVFKRAKNIEIDQLGSYEVYANRDSIQYLNLYNLKNLHTFERGTIRGKGYCKAWDVLVNLGLTDDSYLIENSNTLSYLDFMCLFLEETDVSIKDNISKCYGSTIDNDIYLNLQELDLFNQEIMITLKQGTPAMILEHILAKKWSLKPLDKDMIIMTHQISYNLKGIKYCQEATMICRGEDQIYTAMAKTVGLPLAIAAIEILNGNITDTGVLLPTDKTIYEPILRELKKCGISFSKKITRLP